MKTKTKVKIAALFLCGAIVVPVFVFFIPVARADITTGLVGYWNFDEGSGTNAADSSVSGNSGTLISSPTWGSAKINNGLVFNGSNYVDVGNPASLQLTGSMTLSGWVYATANPADDGQIIAKSNDNDGWQLKTSPDTGSHTFAVALGRGTYHTQRYSATVRQLNAWYHVTGVYNASSQTLDIYVNGQLDNGILSNGPVPPSQTNANLNVNIGRRTGGYNFIGTLDDVRVYNRVLSASDISELYSFTGGGSPPPAPPPPPPPSPTPTPPPPPAPPPADTTAPVLSIIGAHNITSSSVAS